MLLNFARMSCLREIRARYAGTQHYAARIFDSKSVSVFMSVSLSLQFNILVEYSTMHSVIDTNRGNVQFIEIFATIMNTLRWFHKFLKYFKSMTSFVYFFLSKTLYITGSLFFIIKPYPISNRPSGVTIRTKCRRRH